MSDLISRQDAIDAIMDLLNCPNGYSDTYDKTYIIGVIEGLPSAQRWMTATSNTIASDTVKIPIMDGTTGRLPSAQTKKGKWIQSEQDKKVVPEGSVWWRCSCCNSPALEGRLTMYCPNCGADMRSI